MPSYQRLNVTSGFVVAQAPQPRAMWRHAPDRIGHRHQHPAHAVPVRLRQQMPAAVINPVVDIARSQLEAEIEGSAHGALNAAIPESRLGRASLQITGCRLRAGRSTRLAPHAGAYPRKTPVRAFAHSRKLVAFPSSAGQHKKFTGRLS
jgi:hypothetical protein